MAPATFSFLPTGAIIQSITLDNGLNIVHGFPTTEEYQQYNGPFYGETIGRVANRIKDARIASLNGGQSYQLAANNGGNSLHGGTVGWGKRVWDGPKPVGLREVPGLEGLQGGESIQFSLVSPDGEEGFPGEVHARCTYTTGTQVGEDGKEVSVLAFEYEAELVSGADETVINMTNHSYFNLTGGPSIEGTNVTLATNQALPLDETSVPTGGPEPYSKFSGNQPFRLGAAEPDVDNVFVVNEAPETVKIDTRGEPLVRLAAADHPDSGVHLEVLSTEPGFQFYTGRFIDTPATPGGATAKGPRSAFCVEPSRYVNAINVPEWKHMVVLKKGEKYGARNVYRVWRE